LKYFSQNGIFHTNFKSLSIVIQIPTEIFRPICIGNQPIMSLVLAEDGSAGLANATSHFKLNFHISYCL
jgi:hypothetical protein